MRPPSLLAISCLLTMAISAALRAESPIRVGVTVAPPFVQRDSRGELSGYSIDLWSQIANRIGETTAIQEFETFEQLLEAVSAGTIDVAAADIFITSQREQHMEFSHPIADGGLRVLVKGKPAHSLSRLWQDLIDNGHARVLGYGALCIVTLSVVLMVFWRRVEKDFPTTMHDGFAEAFYRTVTLAMSGKTKVGTTSLWHMKVLAGVWLAIGVGIVAYVTSSLTTVMTAASLTRQVNGIDDVGGRTVGVVKGTVSEAYCRKRNLDVVAYDTLQETASALLGGSVEAVVGGAPLLAAYDHAHPELDVTTVGPVFECRHLGFAMPTGSALRHRVNIALLELTESGDVGKLNAQYFGGS